MTSAAPASASRRSAIGVAPACVAAPRRISRRSCGAAIAVTTPIGSPMRLEHRGLLDVQLDERVHGRRIEPRLGDPARGRSPPRAVRRRARRRRGRARLEGVRAERADERATADAAGAEARLLPGDGDHLEAAARREAGVAQRAHRLDRAQHADDAVVAAGVERRVDVRAGDHARCVRLAARPAAPEVAERVEARLEARAAHPLRHPLQGLRVGRREHLARDPAGLGVVVELREPVDRRVEAVAHAAPGVTSRPQRLAHEPPVGEHRPPAQDRAHDPRAQRAPDERRDAVALVQVLGAQLVARRPVDEHEVGVGARLDPALAREPQPPGREAGQRLGDAVLAGAGPRRARAAASSALPRSRPTRAARRPPSCAAARASGRRRPSAASRRRARPTAPRAPRPGAAAARTSRPRRGAPRPPR